MIFPFFPFLEINKYVTFVHFDLYNVFEFTSSLFEFKFEGF